MMRYKKSAASLAWGSNRIVLSEMSYKCAAKILTHGGTSPLDKLVKGEEWASIDMAFA